MISDIIDVCIIRDAVAPALTASAYDVFRRVTIPPNTLFVPIANIEEPEVWGEKYNANIVQFLIWYMKRLLCIVGDINSENCYGLEVWTNCVRECGENVVFHVDNDELLREQTGEVRTPSIGSILYLGPEEFLNGGGTCLCLEKDVIHLFSDFLFVSRRWSELDEAIRGKSLIVPFQSGRLIIFKGDLGHCVVPFAATDLSHPRVALLVNFWRQPLFGGALASARP